MRNMVHAIAAVAACLPAAPAHAAEARYCQHYANRAVSQFRRYLEIPGCYQEQTLRWNKDRDGHYAWCLGVPVTAAFEEDNFREQRLRECAGAIKERY